MFLVEINVPQNLFVLEFLHSLVPGANKCQLGVSNRQGLLLLQCGTQGPNKARCACWGARQLRESPPSQNGVAGPSALFEPGFQCTTLSAGESSCVFSRLFIPMWGAGASGF